MNNKLSANSTGFAPVQQNGYIKNGTFVAPSTRSKPGTPLDKHGQLKKPRLK